MIPITPELYNALLKFLGKHKHDKVRGLYDALLQAKQQSEQQGLRPVPDVTEKENA